MTVATKPPLLGEGDRIAGDYVVVAALHRSRMLDVYDVFSESRACRCVAKVLRPDRSREEFARGALLSEGRLLRSFTHPHVVRAYEVVEEPEPVVILEMLRGETLEQSLGPEPGRLPVAELAILGTQVCSALHYLHERGTLHLDLKPSNVVLDRGMATLIDFSVARPPGPLRSPVGTRRYMSPEQARGGTVGVAADVWGAGMVLFRAAAGRHVFEARGEGYPQLVRRAQPVARTSSRLPHRVATAIDAALDPEPDARPTVRELAEALAGD